MVILLRYLLNEQLAIIEYSFRFVSSFSKTLLLNSLVFALALCGFQACARPQTHYEVLPEKRAGISLAKRIKATSTQQQAVVSSIIERTPRVREPLRAFTTQERTRIKKVQRIVGKASKKYYISKALINGIIWVESKFITMSRGYKGSRGLMQLMPRTSRALARELKMKHRPYSPRFNIEAGTYYFSKLKRRFNGNIKLALAAYKQGCGSVKDYLRRGELLPGPSQRYIQRVLIAAQAFQNRLGGEERSY